MKFCCRGTPDGPPPGRQVSSRRLSGFHEGNDDIKVEVDETCDVVRFIPPDNDPPPSIGMLSRELSPSPSVGTPTSNMGGVPSLGLSAVGSHGALSGGDKRSFCNKNKNPTHHWETDIVNNTSGKLLHASVSDRFADSSETLKPPARTASQPNRSTHTQDQTAYEGHRRPSKLCGDRFLGPRNEVGALARNIVARVMELVNHVDDETTDVCDHLWRGPIEDGDKLIEWLLDDSVRAFTGYETHDQCVKALAEGVEEKLHEQDTLVHLRAPCKIFGDIHGQLRDLLLFFNEFGKPTVGQGGDIEMVSYIFNGDWVDRGTHQVEVVVTLFALKITYPERIWLIRGNHEDAVQNMQPHQKNGFGAACQECFGQFLGDSVFNNVHKAFDMLPLAAVIEDRILVVHGGIGDGNWDLEYLHKKVKRPLDHAALAKDKILYNLLWSDPVPENATMEGSSKGADPDAHNNETFGVHKSTRGQNKTLKRFGADITLSFCERNNLGLIIRSHQCSREGYGYSVMHKGHLMRVFSARHYDKTQGNAAAMLLVGYKRFRTTDDRGLVVRAKVIRPPPIVKKNSKKRLDLVRSFSSGSLPAVEPDDQDVKVATPCAAQKKLAEKAAVKICDHGVQVDQDCDVVNKSESGREGHRFQAQNWHNDHASSSQKLHEDAVIGRVSLCSDRFMGPQDETGKLAHALVDRFMELVDIIAEEVQDVLDQHWYGPVDCKGDLFPWLLSPPPVQEACKGSTPAQVIGQLCSAAKKIMLDQPTLVELRAPAKIFGDLRGHLRDVLHFFDEFGRPTVGRNSDIEVCSYVFNGGWVDKGNHQLEVVIMLLALKVTYPERVWLVRGSHEGETEKFHPHRKAFDDTCDKIFGVQHGHAVSDQVFQVFDCLPLAVTIEKSVLVVHGGIGNGKWDLSYLAGIKRPLTSTDLERDRLLFDILWSQPSKDASAPKDVLSRVDSARCLEPIDMAEFARQVSAGSQESTSSTESRWRKSVGDGKQDHVRQVTMFSADDTRAFCNRNNIGLIIRSHQYVQHGFGYSLLHDGRLMCVFSARNYQVNDNNAAAMLLVGYKRLRNHSARGLVIRAKVIAAPDDHSHKEHQKNAMGNGLPHESPRLIAQDPPWDMKNGSGGGKFMRGATVTFNLAETADDTDISPKLKLLGENAQKVEKSRAIKKHTRCSIGCFRWLPCQ